jgi:nucleoside-diphosphate-sugar epimerase
MQTILGSGGTIGLPLARELNRYTDRIRLVSRNPKKVNESDEPYPADVTDPSQIDGAVSGSHVVYVAVGFEYRLSVWQETWLPFVTGVVDACKRHGSRLVFFDNVYMYDKSAMPCMTESSPVNAPSRKGRIRQQVHELIMEEVGNGGLTALIARSADFYGPMNRNSMLNIMAAENLVKGKKAQVFGGLDKVHTYTYTPDAAAATALLGNTDDAYGQVWHVPTTDERITQRQWVRMIAEELGVQAKTQPVPRWMIKMLGLFVPVMREFPEMLYQYENDYVFDSGKFEKRFGITATKPAEGVRNLVAYLKNVGSPS